MNALAPSAVLLNGDIYAASADQEWVEALAITDTTISALGTTEQVRSIAGPDTDIVDLAGATVLPGFIDAHVHPIEGGGELLECSLANFGSQPEYLAAITAYASTYAGEWITGGGWSMPAFERGVPDADTLDPVTAGRPTILYNRDHHSAWVNSAALALAGIDRDTPDPAGGRIERDADGRPTGALHEAAMKLVARLVPEPGPGHRREALRAGLGYLNRLGITGWQDAKVRNDEDVAAYLELQRSGELTARVVGAFWLDPAQGIEQVNGIIERTAGLEPGLFELRSVKIMLDGVCETHTAAMSSPYLDGHGHSTENSGIAFFDPDLVRECARRLDAAGLQLHFHAVGDAAVTEALDVVSGVIEANGVRPRRPHVAHVQVVHPRDIPRFRQLNMTVNAQPLWARLEPQMTELTLPYLGADRGHWQYPFGDLENSGARIAFGSDWPVSTPDPIRQIHVAVNRTPVPDRTSWRPEDGTFLPEQCLSLPAAIRAFTEGSAWVNSHEAVSGTIAVGKSADLVVLDSNPFSRPRSEIWQSKVQQTWFAGSAVAQGNHR